MDATRALAHFVVQSRFDEIPEAARHEARRSLVNWLGCALGGSRHEAVSIALAALAPFSGPPQASVLGRCERLDILHAAQNGMTAALLAAQGFTSSERAIEAPRGFAHVLAADRRLEEITDRLGERYEIELNAYKPYACGVVCHPVIDGCIQLRDGRSLKPNQIAAVELRVHPLALKLTGIKAPQGGLESKWSIYHSAAVALCDGAAGEHQYTDERVRGPEVQRLRERISAEPDASLREDEAHVAITLADGTLLERHIEHATGSAGNPMSDRDLDDKLRGLADGVLPPAQTNALIEKCWSVAALADVAEIARMAVPKSSSVLP